MLKDVYRGIHTYAADWVGTNGRQYIFMEISNGEEAVKQ